MNRTLIVVVFAAAGAIGTTAAGQSWMFQPGTYSGSPSGGGQTPGARPAAPSAAGSVLGPASTSAVPGPAVGPRTPSPTPGVRTFATFTESQAAEAAKLPKPAFQWDPTGVFGRAMRYQNWSREESIEAGRLRAYSQGVRDAVGGPVWTWGGGAVQPLPQIVAPTEDSPGKRRLPLAP